LKLLLDTQIAVWWQIAPERISSAVEQVVTREAEEVFLSRASLWEMAIKINTAKLHIDLARFVRQSEADGFRWLDIATEHILACASLPTFADHKDPFDRLLVAQSIAEPLILLTADKQLPRYGATVRVI
jgi:PIN domain nuclease of toxin-antitoxin system